MAMTSHRFLVNTGHLSSLFLILLAPAAGAAAGKKTAKAGNETAGFILILWQKAIIAPAGMATTPW
ncbi:hypothetical protein F9C28_14620 [Shimwellia pseudoproteus]|uniref:hypothetical protein n=1 Tax=Shimwellia pseudoproteus TaxID=570012 RepID=UPI0018ECAA3E|nr:hypothetical protein [Shimwellia pseudoproteus]MBJ3816129.1 hypothetical protein [Shimwellia pseudoproteus]